MTTIAMVVEREGEEIEVEVSFSMASAEPDVGIFEAFADDLEATGPDGKPFELTEGEFERAAELAALADADREDGCDEE